MVADSSEIFAPPASLQAFVNELSSAGSRTAILAFEDGTEQRLTYEELTAAAARQARHLRDQGIGAGDPVVLTGQGGLAWVTNLLALFHCNACPVPVDVQMSIRSFEHVLKDSGARHALLGADAADRFEAPCDRAGIVAARIGAAGAAGQGTEEQQETETPLYSATDPKDRAILFYTSGTTGPPKGVPLTHQNVIHQHGVLAGAGVVSRDDRILLPLPPHHVYPLVIGILAPLALRLTLVLPSGFTGGQILDALNRGRATLMIGVPRLYEALTDGIETRFSSSLPLGRSLYHGGLALSRFFLDYGLPIGPALFRPLRRRFGPALRTVVSGGAALKPRPARTLEAMGWQVATGYGLTETSPLLTLVRQGEGHLETAGRAVKGVELKTDPPGTADRPGEVLARGPGVFHGYLNLPDKTREVLSDDGWFRTGDLGWIDDQGYLHLTGRKSTLMVTAGGENVQPDDIEEAYGAHEAISEIAVFEREGRILGLIVPAPSLGARDDRATLIREAVREVSRTLSSYQNLAEYRLTGESLPRTRLGKIRRHLVEERYDMAGAADRGEGRSEDTAWPREELSIEDEALLADERAARTFDLVRKRAGRARLTFDSDLGLDIGIDSIEWLNLSLEISEATGVGLSESAIAEIRTVRELLQRVTGGSEPGIDLETALSDPDQVLSESDRRWLDPPGPLGKCVAYAGATLNMLLVRAVFRLRVTGLENLPVDAPCVLTPNHASYLDPLIIGAALGPGRLRHFCWAGWTGMLFRGPLSRAISRAARVLPIDPVGRAASSLAYGAAALKRKTSLIWFPEGARSIDGRLGTFRPGIGLVTDHWPARIVPVVIAGSFEAWPRGRRWPRPHPVRVSFLPAVDAAVLARDGKGDTNAERIVNGLRRRMADALAD